MAQHQPHIAIEVIAASVLSMQPPTLRTLMPGDLVSLGSEEQAFHVVNTGPGVAAAIDVVGLLPGGGEVKQPPPRRRVVAVLGVGQRYQITFPTPLVAELWGANTVGEKFAFLVWATGTASWPDDEDGRYADELGCGALGGFVAEAVERDDGGSGIGFAWRILSDQECVQLINRKIRPMDLPAQPGSLGRRRARFGLNEVVMT
jgi:hypothetical protein